MHSQKTLGAGTGRVVALLCAALLVACGGGTSSEPNQTTDGVAVDGELNVGVRAGSIPNYAVEAIIASQGQILIADARTSFYRVALHPGVSVDQARAVLVHPDIVVVEPNYLAWGYATPDDPMYTSSQYSTKIKAELEAAWDAYNAATATRGPVIIAVLDTGIRATHADLAAKVDPTDWKDYVDQANTTVVDDHGHGTQLAGIAAAEVNNGVGLAGVASWYGAGADPGLVTIMPVKVADSNNVSNHAAIAAGMSWAVAHNANIILLSLGSATPSWTLQKAVQDAYAAGVLVVAAAGNDGTSSMRYPAAYQGTNQNVLSVGSVNAADAIDTSNRTNYGAWVNVLAPGASLWSTSNAGDAAYVGSLAGSSYAAAHVAGVAALVWSAYVPSTAHGAGVLTVSEVRNAVLAGLDSYDRSTANTISAAGGRVNAQKALAAAANIQSHAAGSAMPGSVVFSGTALRGGAAAVGTVVLTDPAPASTVIALVSSDPHLVVPTAGVTVLRGARSATFAIATTPVATRTAVVVTATGSSGVVATGSVDLTAPGVARIALSPSSAVGGANVSGTVTLAGAAPVGGVDVTLSDDSAYASFATTVVTVAANQLSAGFTVNTQAVPSQQTVRITGTANGVAASAVLTLKPVLSSVAFTPTSVKGGASATLRITLGAAQATDTTVDVSFTGDTTAIAPESLVTTATITAGQTSRALTVRTVPVTGAATITATASYGGVTTPAATLLVNTPALGSLTGTSGALIWWDATHVSTGIGTLTLDAVAASTTTVYLSANNSVLAVPATVRIAAGSRSATFTATPAAVVSPVAVTVTASLTPEYTVKKTVTFQLKPALLNMTLSPTQVAGGATAVGTVTLSAAAPTGGFEVTLLSGDETRVAVDPSVIVSAGRTTATFDAVTIASPASGSVYVSAEANGVTKRVALRITAPGISTVTFNPTSATVGDSVTGTVTLSAAALGRTQVNLASNDTTAIPGLNPIYIATGVTTGTFTFTAGAVTSQKTVTVTASLNGTPRTGSIVIRPAAVALGLSAASVGGGGTATGTVTLASSAPVGGTAVTLASSDPAAVFTTAVTVLSGQRTANFSITTAGVDADTAVSVSATSGGVTASRVLTVLKAVYQSITSAVTITSPATTANVTVQLSARVGPTPVTVTIDPSGLNTAVATVAGPGTIASPSTSGVITVTAVAAGTTSFDVTVLGTTHRVGVTVN